MTGYTLNQQYAREGSTGGGAGRLYTGGFEGVFTKASEYSNANGTRGISFEFRADTGEVGGFTLYTYNGKGEPLAGLKRLNALMTCMKLKAINPVRGQYEEYDQATRQRIQVSGNVFPELLNKRVGLVIQMEEYAKTDGSTGQRPTLYAPYDPESKKLAAEIWDNKPATGLANILKTIKDRPLRKQSAGYAGGNAGYDDSLPPIDLDDVPF